MKVPEKLIKETKAMIMLYLFLRHECGLRYTDRLSAKELKGLLLALKRGKICLFYKEIIMRLK